MRHKGIRERAEGVEMEEGGGKEMDGEGGRLFMFLGKILN